MLSSCLDDMHNIHFLDRHPTANRNTYQCHSSIRNECLHVLSLWEKGTPCLSYVIRNKIQCHSKTFEIDFNRMQVLFAQTISTQRYLTVVGCPFFLACVRACLRWHITKNARSIFCLPSTKKRITGKIEFK